VIRFPFAGEAERDEDKAAIIMGQTGLTTYRFWNKWFMAPDLQIKIAHLLAQHGRR
jgi:hypothetical protein